MSNYGRPECEVKRPPALDDVGVPVSDIGRLELEISKGNLMVNQYFALEKETPANYSLPAYDVGFDNYWGMMKAYKKKDKKKVMQCSKKIYETPIRVEFKSSGRDFMSIAATNYEKSFFDVFSLTDYVTKHELLGIRVVNPSKGTIKRLADTGQVYDVILTPLPDKIKYAESYERVEDIMRAVGYSAQILELSWQRFDPNYLYYMSFSADKGEQHGLEHFIGFEIDPYTALVKGKQFETVIMADDFMDLQYIRSDYVASCRHYYKPLSQRLPVDLTIDFLSKSTSWYPEIYNGIYTILTTMKLEVESRPITSGELDPVGLNFAYATDVVTTECSVEVPGTGEIFTSNFVIGEDASYNEIFLDVCIPEVFSQRQELLKRLELPLVRWSTIKNLTDNYAAHPSTGSITQLTTPDELVYGEIVNSVQKTTYTVANAFRFVTPPPVDLVPSLGLLEVEEGVFAHPVGCIMPNRGVPFKMEKFVDLVVNTNLVLSGTNVERVGEFAYKIYESYSFYENSKPVKKLKARMKHVDTIYFFLDRTPMPQRRADLPEIIRMIDLPLLNPIVNNIILGANIKKSVFFSCTYKDDVYYNLNNELPSPVFAYSPSPPMAFFEDPGGTLAIFPHPNGSFFRGGIPYAIFHDPYSLLGSNMSFFDAVTSGDYFSRETWSQVSTTMVEIVKLKNNIKMHDPEGAIGNDDLNIDDWFD